MLGRTVEYHFFQRAVLSSAALKVLRPKAQKENSLMDGLTLSRTIKSAHDSFEISLKVEQEYVDQHLQVDAELQGVQPKDYVKNFYS